MDFRDCIQFVTESQATCTLCTIDPSSMKNSEDFKGALTENFVLQSLAGIYEAIPRYWTSGGQAEVDYIIQRGNEIIPIEVKADQNVNSRSLL